MGLLTDSLGWTDGAGGLDFSSSNTEPLPSSSGGFFSALNYDKIKGFAEDAVGLGAGVATIYGLFKGSGDAASANGGPETVHQANVPPQAADTRGISSYGIQPVHLVVGALALAAVVLVVKLAK